MFPMGAINYPSLFASACVLFDSVIVLRPVDLVGIYWSYDDFWDYTLFENSNADKFWKECAALSDEGVLQMFSSSSVLAERDRHEPPGESLKSDLVESGMFGTHFAVGFTEFFRFLRETRVPVVLSPSELCANLGANRIDSAAIAIPSLLGSLSSRLLAECIPTIGVGNGPDGFSRRIGAIREGVKDERVHFKAFVKILSSTIADQLTAEDKRLQIEILVRDYKSVWEAYRSKLSEVSRRLETPLRFVSIIRSIVTLDFLTAARDALDSKPDSVIARQEKHSLGFVRDVARLNDYWSPR